MYPAGVLSVLVTATTGQANASLRKTQTMFRATAATSETAASRTSAAWKKTGFVVAAGAAFAGAASAKLSIDFEKAMRNVNSLAQLPEPAFHRLEQNVLALAGPTAQAPQTLAEGMYDLVSSGFDAKESLTIVKQSAFAATAGLTDTKTATKAVAAVLNAYRMPASKAKDVSDQLFSTVNYGVLTFEDLALHIGDTLPFASQLGVQLKEVGAATATMTKQGLSAPETMTRIRNVMQTLIKPGDDLKATFKELGMSGEDMIKKFGFQGTLEKLAATTDGTKEAMAALFPNIRALGGVLALTGTNAKAADKDLARMGRSGGETARVFAEQSKSIAFQWQKVKAELAATAITLGTALLPVLLKGIEALRASVNGLVSFGKWVGDLPTPLLAAAGALTGTYLALRLVTAAMAAFGVTSFIGGMGQVISITGIAIKDMGLLRGAWMLLTLAFEASPFGVIAAGVGIAVGAYVALKGVLGDTGDAAESTGRRLKHAFDKQQESVKNLRKSAQDVANANKHQKKTSEELKQAEANLQRARNKYPANSEQVIDAERKVRKAKDADRHASMRLKRAEQEHGVQRGITMRLDKAAAQQEQRRIVVLRQTRKRILDNVKATGIKNMSDAQLAHTGRTLDNITGKIGKSQQHLNTILKNAADQISPKFSKEISHMSDNTKTWKDRLEEVGQANRKANRETTDTTRSVQRASGTFKDTAGKTQDLAKETDHASDRMKNFGSTGRKTADMVTSSVGHVLKQLGISDSQFGAHQKKQKKAHGGFVVPGRPGGGDQVPVNLMLERGEVGFILNANAASTLSSLKKANEMFPRSRMAAGGMIDPSWDPGSERLNAAISGTVGKWATMYSADMTAGYDPGGGHISPGHNVTGTATDMVPKAGWTPQATALFERGLRAIENTVDQLLYGTAGIGQPYPNHGRGNHAHIEWGLSPAFAGGGSTIPRILISGPSGELKTILQTSADAMVKEANKKLRAQMGSVGGGDLTAMSGAGMFSKSELIALWKQVNGGLGDSNLMAAIALAESGGDPNASNGPYHGLWQVGPGGPFDPVENARVAGMKLRTQGLSAWEAYTNGHYRSFLKEGGLVKAQKMMKHLHKLIHGTERLDERIDIAERLSELGSSQFGSDLSPSEISKQIDLNIDLMKNLKKERNAARQGSRFTERLIKNFKHGKDHKTESLKNKLDRLQDEHDRIRAKEHKKKNPNLNATNQVDHSIEKTQADIADRRDELQRVMGKLRGLSSTFKDTVKEMQGVTGKGGRIFDTKLQLDTLRHTSTGILGGTGMSVEQLMAFAEAVRLGAFTSGLPAFHGGGRVMPPRAGQQEMAAMVRKDEVVFTPDQIGAMRGGGDTVVYIGIPDSMAFLEGKIDVQIEKNGRKAEASYRARRK